MLIFGNFVLYEFFSILHLAVIGMVVVVVVDGKFWKYLHEIRSACPYILDGGQLTAIIPKISFLPSKNQNSEFKNRISRIIRRKLTSSSYTWCRQQELRTQNLKTRKQPKFEWNVLFYSVEIQVNRQTDERNSRKETNNKHKQKTGRKERETESRVKIVFPFISRSWQWKQRWKMVRSTLPPSAVGLLVRCRCDDGRHRGRGWHCI